MELFGEVEEEQRVELGEEPLGELGVEPLAEPLEEPREGQLEGQPGEQWVPLGQALGEVLEPPLGPLAWLPQELSFEGLLLAVVER